MNPSILTILGPETARRKKMNTFFLRQTHPFELCGGLYQPEAVRIKVLKCEFL